MIEDAGCGKTTLAIAFRASRGLLITVYSLSTSDVLPHIVGFKHAPERDGIVLCTIRERSCNLFLCG